MEECSQKGCLALSLLELLGFNLTFVFLASLLVLIEVRCSQVSVQALRVFPLSVSRASGNSYPENIDFLQKWLLIYSQTPVSDDTEEESPRSGGGSGLSSTRRHLENFQKLLRPGPALTNDQNPH